MALRRALLDWWHRRKSDAVDVPTYWRRYRGLWPARQPESTALEDIRFVVLDTETTGLDHTRDRVVSFGAVRVRGNAIDVADAVDWRVQAKLPSSRASIEVHGVLNGELETGIPEARFVERLVDYVGNDVLVGYRPGFDLAILNRLVREHTGDRLRNRSLDVFDIGMRVDYPLKPGFVNPEPYRFDALCARYAIENPDRHTALGDAYATALLLLKLLAKLKSGGTSTLGHLLQRYG